MPAGVCQTAEDRCDRDPQLKPLEWLTEVTGTKIGRWPLAEVPIKLSESPAYIGGRIDRGAPCYGEDNEYVFGELLGMSNERDRGARRGGRYLTSRSLVACWCCAHIMRTRKFRRPRPTRHAQCA